MASRRAQNPTSSPLFARSGALYVSLRPSSRQLSWAGLPNGPVGSSRGVSSCGDVSSGRPPPRGALLVPL
eukprot:7451790-Pyramimonas_sp.AAC.1